MSLALVQLQARNARSVTPIEAAASIPQGANARAVNIIIMADRSAGRSVRRLRFRHVTQACIRAITELPCLQEFFIIDCRRLHHIAPLLRSCMTTLKWLQFQRTGIAQSGIAGVSLPALDILEIEDCHGITDLRALLPSPQHALRQLSVRHTGISQEGIAGIEAPKLERLVIVDSSGITDLTTLLRGCTSLRGLILRDAGVAQDGIVGVTAPLLQELELRNCPGITDVRPMLKGCKSLRVFHISGSVLEGRTNVWSPYRRNACSMQ